MVNPQHMAWIKEGVADWNARRKRAPFTPDLSGAGLPSAEFPKHDLSAIDLSGANLEGCRLEGFTLRDVKLVEANLREAKLSMADLAGATLVRADLTGADFSMVDLAGANLSKAILSNTTILTNARLVGADFTNAAPFEAVLYSPVGLGQRDISGAMSVTSIECLLSAIREIKEAYIEASLEFSLYFRGEPEIGRSLTPQAKREPMITSEQEALDDLIAKRPDDFRHTASAIDRWVLARHHSLRTRFLDVTRNPLTALFFSCEKGEQNVKNPTSPVMLHIFVVPKILIKSSASSVASLVSNFAKMPKTEQNLLLGVHGEMFNLGTAIWRKTGVQSPYTVATKRLHDLVRSDDLHHQEPINIRDFYCVFVIEPRQIHERIRAQSGAFMVSAYHERFERENVLGVNPNIPMYAHYTLTIPEDSKSSILKDLQSVNITREALFPGLDESAQAINRAHSAHGYSR